MAGKFPWGAPGRNHSFFFRPRRPPKSILRGSWRRPCAQEAPGPPKTPSGEPFWTNFWCFLDVFSCCARVCFLLFSGSVFRLICVSVFFVFQRRAKTRTCSKYLPCQCFSMFFQGPLSRRRRDNKAKSPTKTFPKKASRK